MKKLDSAQSAVFTIMEKLGPVCEIIAQGADEWEEWKLEQLTENVRKYVDRNLIKSGDEFKLDFVNQGRFQEQTSYFLVTNKTSEELVTDVFTVGTISTKAQTAQGSSVLPADGRS